MGALRMSQLEQNSSSTITISLCIIAKNEAATIERCLYLIVNATDEFVNYDHVSKKTIQKFGGCQ